MQIQHWAFSWFVCSFDVQYYLHVVDTRHTCLPQRFKYSKFVNTMNLMSQMQVIYFPPSSVSIWLQFCGERKRLNMEEDLTYGEMYIYGSFLWHCSGHVYIEEMTVTAFGKSYSTLLSWAINNARLNTEIFPDFLKRDMVCTISTEHLENLRHHRSTKLLHYTSGE